MIITKLLEFLLHAQWYVEHFQNMNNPLLSYLLQQTIGHATAMKYTQNQAVKSTGLQRKIAGQMGNIPLVTPNISTIKVVEWDLNNFCF